MIEESENTENMYAYWFELIGLMCMLLGFNLKANLNDIWLSDMVFGNSLCYVLMIETILKEVSIFVFGQCYWLNKG